MATPSERRALLFVAAVAALGLGVRGLRVLGAGQGTPEARAALAAQIAAVDSAVTSGGRSRRAPSARTAASAPRPSPHPSSGAEAAPQRPVQAVPTAPSGPIDVDRASAEELDRLPGIGPALARRIIEDREAHGAFGSVDGLQRVRGIGPALAARLAPLVTFSGLPRPSPAR